MKPKAPLRGRVGGVGIDLVNLKRARQFLKNHRRRIHDRLLAPAEKKTFARRRLSPVEFSKRFAAKEAFFKARGGTWMGIDGFGAVEVKCLPSGRFKVKSVGNGRAPEARGEGCFFSGDTWIGAQVIVWT